MATVLGGVVQFHVLPQTPAPFPAILCFCAELGLFQKK